MRPMNEEQVDWVERHQENIEWCKLWTNLMYAMMFLTVCSIVSLIIWPNDRWWFIIIPIAGFFVFWVARLECLDRDIKLHKERDDMF